MERSELEVVMEQLDELLAAGIDDAEDAIEVAILAGTATRLGADPTWLVDAETWRDGPGADLLDEAFELLDLEPLIEAVDEVSYGSSTDEEIEEAIFDYDDIVAAAVWCDREDVVAAGSARVEGIIRELPDVFTDMAPYGALLAGRRHVAERLHVYGYWLALADAGGLAEDA